jgi:hypothetical protein
MPPVARIVASNGLSNHRPSNVFADLASRAPGRTICATYCKARIDEYSISVGERQPAQQVCIAKNSFPVSRASLRTFLRKLNYCANYNRKWQKPYSQVCGYVKARLSIAAVRATHLCLRGSRVPAHNISTRFSQWEDGAGLAMHEWT